MREMFVNPLTHPPKEEEG